MCKNHPAGFWPLLPSQPRSGRACLLGLFFALAVNFKLLRAGLVPQRLAIDAALERQRAIVDSLELDAEHRKATSKSNNSSSNNSDRPPGGQPPQGSGGRQGRGSGGERNVGKKRGEVAHSNKLSDVVRKLEYSLHSDSEGMCICLHAHMLACTHTHTQAHTHRHRHVHASTCMYTNAPVSYTHLTLPTIDDV